MRWLRWLVCCTCVALSGVPAARAEAPALFWTHFEMGTPEHCGGVKWCPSVAFNALADEGFNPKRDGTVGAFGSNSDTTVVVDCTSMGGGRMSAGIFAAAANARTAEDVRNRIQRRMQGARCI